MSDIASIELREALRYVAGLEAENERLKQDAARLDALEEKIDVVRYSNGSWSALYKGTSYGRFSTVRAAIDAAMKESEGI